VLIFDVRDKVNRPIFQSTVKTGKHSDPVWQAAPSLSAHPPGTYHSHRPVRPRTSLCNKRTPLRPARRERAAADAPHAHAASKVRVSIDAPLR
jgi:hypothetical protein